MKVTRLVQITMNIELRFLISHIWQNLLSQIKQNSHEWPMMSITSGLSCPSSYMKRPTLKMQVSVWGGFMSLETYSQFDHSNDGKELSLIFVETFTILTCIFALHPHKFYKVLLLTLQIAFVRRFLISQC